MSLARYAALTGATVAVSLAAILPQLAPEARPSVLFGGLLALANAVAAYGLALWSAARSTQAFLTAVLGGMVGRMGIMLAAFVGAVLGLGFPPVPLAVALLAYFVLFLMLELALLSRMPARAGAR